MNPRSRAMHALSKSPSGSAPSACFVRMDTNYIPWPQNEHLLTRHAHSCLRQCSAHGVFAASDHAYIDWTEGALQTRAVLLEGSSPHQDQKTIKLSAVYPIFSRLGSVPNLTMPGGPAHHPRNVIFFWHSAPLREICLDPVTCNSDCHSPLFSTKPRPVLKHVFDEAKCAWSSCSGYCAQCSSHVLTFECLSSVCAISCGVSSYAYEMFPLTG